GAYEQLADFESINGAAALLRVRRPDRQVKPLLEPTAHAISPLQGAIEGILGNDAAGKIGRGASHRGEVGVQHQVDDAAIGNGGIVDLNLVGLGGGGARKDDGERGERKCKVFVSHQSSFVRPSASSFFTTSPTFCALARGTMSRASLVST